MRKSCQMRRRSLLAKVKTEKKKEAKTDASAQWQKGRRRGNWNESSWSNWKWNADSWWQSGAQGESQDAENWKHASEGEAAHDPGQRWIAKDDEEKGQEAEP